MPLAVGSRLGPYEVLAGLGAGGMGEVFRARDATLNRDVAIKMLPAALASDTERLARFKREAQVLASLNHPNIAHVYGFEGATLPDGSTAHFLAMELVEGEDLAERLKRGAIPVDEAVAIAKQIAEGLEEAHEHGIIHRDLKPANVKVTPDGKVKVLDFGLAKALDGDSRGRSSPQLSHSPTLSRHATEAGLILGTAAYMSPEQARGKAVDKRADIWSFGVVLFEMLTGRRLFHGETVSDTLAAVLRQEIDWTALPESTPARLRLLLQRGLERDPKLRLRDIGEATIALGTAAASVDPPVTPVPRPRLTRRGAAGLLLGALVAGGAGALVARGLPPRAAIPALARLTYTFRPGAGLPRGTRLLNSIALSPDGARLAFAGGDRIFVRPLDSLVPFEVPGSGNGADPFFSPDGTWLGFSAGASLWKINLAGGSPIRLSAPGGTASWSEDGSILVGTGAGVLRVPPEGGAPQTLVAIEPGYVAYSNPQSLPGGGFLYTRARPGLDDSSETIVCSRGAKDCASVLVGGSAARYLATGHLVYASAAGVMAVPIDLASRRTKASPLLVEPVAELNVRSYVFDVSASGTLVYGSAASDALPARLAVVSRTGAATALPGEPRYFSDPKISPDGRRAAVHIQDDENDVWVVDLSRGTLLRLSTSVGEDETPVWSPDGRSIAWTGSRPDVPRAVYRRPADGSGSDEILFKSDLHLHLNDWSADGNTLVLQMQDPKTGPDLYTLDVASGKAGVLLQTRFREHSSRLSPSGRHIVYVSDESGREEVYVQAFPVLGGKLRVTTEGGQQPIWSRDGRSIFFRDQSSVLEARFEAGPPASVRTPVTLFPDRFDRPQVGTHTGYDVFPDGRFLMSETTELQAGRVFDSQIVFVLNFLQNMNARPAAR